MGNICRFFNFLIATDYKALSNNANMTQEQMVIQVSSHEGWNTFQDCCLTQITAGDDQLIHTTLNGL